MAITFVIPGIRKWQHFKSDRLSFPASDPTWFISKQRKQKMSHMDNNQEITMDVSALTREEVYTDSRIGSIRKLIPVTLDGEQDSSRPVQFVGSTQIMTPGGALPLSFEIETDTLEGAVAGFGDAAQVAVEKTMEELKEMQRQQASSIVVPGRENNKIQMP
jgi:hypothetical protein